MIDVLDIVAKLKRSSLLNTTSIHFSSNVKAQTPYQQYIVFLSDVHIGDTEDELASSVASVLPAFDIVEIKTIDIKRGRGSVQEVWVFVKQKERKDGA